MTGPYEPYIPGIKDRATIEAMTSVPRDRFVPENLRHAAYNDGPLPIGYGQTISQPFIVALMTELLRPKKQCRILEIGTGSGYQAAVLAHIVERVFSIERLPDLAANARTALESLGYDNVTIKLGDGYDGWPEEAPFDGIIVTAAPHTVPPPLIDQLKEGGRLVVPIGSEFNAQELQVIEKLKGGRIRTTVNCLVRFVPFVRNR